MTRVAARLSISTLLVVSSLALGACKGGNKDNTTADAKAEGGEAQAEAGAEEAAADEAAAETGAAAGTETGAAEPAEADAGTGGETGAAGDETGAADETGADEAGDTTGGEEADPIKPLLDEVTNKRTKDDRAMAALEEAKAAGAEPKDLAAAANKRGERFLTSPERAEKFFEWARQADPKYPNASFNLAKLAANVGEVDRVKELLTETKERGGKKLLKTVGFDPTFALVADDPDVVALTK